MRKSRAWACAGLLLGCVLGQQSAEATTQFVLLGGLTLCAPRTALASALVPSTGMTMGFGFDTNISDHIYLESELLYINRRYAETYNVPTVMIPMLARFENDFLMLGLGPYVAFPLGISSDSDETITPSDLTLGSPDFGMLVDAGFKLPLTKRIRGFADFRVSRALTTSEQGTDLFNWGQVQALVGIQISVGRKR